MGNLQTYDTYRYGFNGKEKDDSFGLTNYDYGFRIYNPTIGKFLSVDPLTGSYPWYTPYQFAGNRPINSIDLDGLEEFQVIDELQFGETKITISTPRTVEQGISYIYNFNSGRFDGFLDGVNPINLLIDFADFIESQRTKYHYYLVTDSRGNQYLIHPSEFQPEYTFEQEAYNDGYSQGKFEGQLTFDVSTALVGEFGIAKALTQYKVYDLKRIKNLLKNANMDGALQAQEEYLKMLESWSGRKRKDITTVVAGVNVETGEIRVAGKSTSTYGGTCCAEDIVVDMLGGDKSKVKMTKAIRPKHKKEIPVCKTCQTKYTKDNFQEGTKFDSP